MKRFKNIVSVLALVLGLAGSVRADDGVSGSGGSDVPGTGDHKSGKKDGIRHGFEIPKIGVPPNASIPDALKVLIKQYQDAAQKFAASQKDLLARLKGATDEEKQKVKEQLKLNRDTFLSDTSQLRSDLREQLRELRNTLKGSTPGGVDTDPKGKGGRKP